MTRTRKAIAASLAAVLAFATTPSFAALKGGAQAPLFTASGAMAGKPITVDLAKALKRGPVVLYFFPAAFTGGCNIEAQAFANAMDGFRKAGATVIGMTAGNTDQLAAFSAEKCAGKFAVAAATPKLIASYDVALTKADGSKTDWSDRTTYVIGQDGRIAFSYSNLKPNEHVAKALAAVRGLAYN
ncbi:peroxiredoxin [Qipengyuania marisflavi]|uniref:thioredoxin-dependent peroxiredoxin n=1 Tax=Qipengyuania marisflavi TaxID=2486356 RepID=A0A5S3P923_9SPHN|nr:redoxin domain-containing protein [Qipengyuania marisflavi]TMM50009.1 redoxin domain-containing protein [Qipengyuania marisflavi]